MSLPSSVTPDIAAAAPLFAALGDETRLALVDRLCADGPLSITQLTSGTDVTRQAVTKHLGVLAAAGLAHDARRGRERLWTVDADRLDAARRYLERVEQQWDQALGRLKALVEE